MTYSSSDTRTRMHGKSTSAGVVMMLCPGPSDHATPVHLVPNLRTCALTPCMCIDSTEIELFATSLNVPRPPVGVHIDCHGWLQALSRLSYGISALCCSWASVTTVLLVSPGGP